MLLKTAGLVIREKKQSEQDILLTILTPENGILLARANSAKRLKSKMAAATEPFAYSEFSLFLRKDIASVDAAEPKNLFFSVRTDPIKTALAAYFCALTYDLCRHSPPEEAAEALRLLLNSFAYLEGDKMDSRQLKALFEMRSMKAAGYAPDLYVCKHCGLRQPKPPMAFLPLQGKVLCEDCLTKEGGSQQLDPDLFAALQHVLSDQLRDAFSFRLGEENTHRLMCICEDYLLARLEYKPATLQYYHTIYNSLSAVS